MQKQVPFGDDKQEQQQQRQLQEQQQQKQIQGFFPFGFAQGQNDERMAVSGLRCCGARNDL